MSKRFFTSLFVLCLLGFNASAKNNNNPFAKNDSLNIGKNVAWEIDKDAGHSTKSSAGNKGDFYHLQLDNRQIKLVISGDASGVKPKQFNQLEIKDLKIDNKQLPLFKWCLKNQQRHSRFLQQGLTVKKDICTIDGKAGSFVMQLNSDTLLALQQGSSLSIVLKPYRTPLELNYDISDLKDMYITLNTKHEAIVPAAVLVSEPPAATGTKLALAKTKKKCRADAAEKYKNIKPVEYDCDDIAAKTAAEKQVAKRVNQEKAKQQKLAAEKEKQHKIAEQKRLKAEAKRLEQKKLLAADAAAVAASEIKQAQIGDEITQKMLNVCGKYWSKGEHRCYCQKYIEHAPSEIQASSTCD